MAGAGAGAFADVVKAMREPITKGFGLLSDFAVRKARTVLGRERMTRASTCPLRARPSSSRSSYRRAGHRRRRTNVLRKHGRDIAEMQFTQRRIADMAIDLYAIAACLARTTRAIERRGEDGARREIDLTAIFTTAAQKRLRQNVFDFTKNDDELRKAVASRSYADGAYPFDIL